MASESQTVQILFATIIIFWSCRSSLITCAGERVKSGCWLSSTASSLTAPEAIDAALFTHIYYAFVGLNPTTFALTLTPADAYFWNFSGIVRNSNPTVKTMISIGGAADSQTFSKMAAADKSRRTFIESSIEVARTNSYDGLDLDWEFPNNEQDMANLGKLVSEWRSAVEDEAAARSLPPLLLTAAVYYNASRFASGQSSTDYTTYPVAVMDQNLDWLNIMSFDLHGSWENITGEHAALYDSKSVYSADYGVRNWFGQGLARHKAVLGIPMYGRSWTLRLPSAMGADTGAGTLAIGPGPSQPLSKTAGIIFYREIRDFILKNNASEKIDSDLVSAYCCHGFVWVGYENPNTVAERVKYLTTKEMKGYFFWSIGYDLNDSLSTSASITLDHLKDTSAEQPARGPSPTPYKASNGSPITTNTICKTLFCLVLLFCLLDNLFIC